MQLDRRPQSYLQPSSSIGAPTFLSFPVQVGRKTLSLNIKTLQSLKAAGICTRQLYFFLSSIIHSCLLFVGDPYINLETLDLPNPAKPTLPPTFGPPITPPQNIAQNGAGSFIPTSNHLESESGGSRRDSGVALRHRLISNSPTDIEVNPVTGEGLRDWLLMMGKKHGIRKRECTSISLHDITPKPESGNWANVLLGHYGKGDRGERVDVYETDM